MCPSFNVQLEFYIRHTCVFAGIHFVVSKKQIQGLRT